MGRKRNGYYLGQSCAANTKTTHPDGSSMPCRRRGVHSLTERGDRRNFKADCTFDVVLGPFRELYCDQHYEAEVRERVAFRSRMKWVSNTSARSSTT